MKVSEIVYCCLDAIKAFSDDSYVNEDHIIFLLGKYRGALLQQYHNIKKVIPDSNFQTVCVNLAPSTTLRCINGPTLRSKEELPFPMPLAHPQVFLDNGFESENIVFVPYARLKGVGWNNWKRNFIYVAIGPDKHLYLTSVNPQAKYLKSLRFRGIFEDYELASELSCEDSEKNCDPMERDFPLEVALIPDLMARVVKDALGMAWRASDGKNDASDNLADIASYIRNNMKKSYRDVTEENE